MPKDESVGTSDGYAHPNPELATESANRVPCRLAFAACTSAFYETFPVSRDETEEDTCTISGTASGTSWPLAICRIKRPGKAMASRSS
jgi:hypothetical protein